MEYIMLEGVKIGTMLRVLCWYSHSAAIYVRTHYTVHQAKRNWLEGFKT